MVRLAFALLAGSLLGLPALGSAADDKNPLCSSADPLIGNLGTALKEQCAYDDVVDNFVQSGLKQLGLKTKNDTGYKEAVGELKKSLTKALPNGNDKPVDVSVENVLITELYTYTRQNEMTIRGYLNLSWTDQRLAWNMESKPKVDKIKIRDDSDIWKPDLGYVLAQSIFRSGDNFDRNTVLFKNGKVVYHLSFWSRGQCPMDLKNYPQDVHHCCINFQSKEYPDLIKMKIRDDQLKLDPDARIVQWKMTPKIIKMNTKSDKRQVLQVCFDVSRASAAYSYMIVLPLASTTVLAVVIPLFTPWKFQIMAKFMSLVFQFICFAATMDQSFLMQADTIPKFVKMYDFVIWTTVVSVTVTTVLWALSRRDKHAVPPPHMLSLLAARINPLFCASAAPPATDSTTLSGEAATAASHNPEWAEVFLAINNVSLIFFTVIYILGIIILAAM